MKIIVYGIGQAYRQIKEYVEKYYEIVALCDKNIKGENIILPSQIKNFKFDKVFVTSDKYMDEITDELFQCYEIGREKIITRADILGEFRNEYVRDQWTIEKLKRLPAGKVLLDAGAGESKYKKYCENLKYIAQDFGQYVPGESAVGLQMESWDYSEGIKSDITNIPLEDKSVDVILCTEVFEHIKNPMLALKEFSRICKSGGELILTAPFCCMTHMAPYFFYNGFSDWWYEEYLETHSFEIIEKIWNGNYFKYIQQELCRLNEMCEKYLNVGLSENSKIKVNELIKEISELSKDDEKSGELLRFSTMIHARKK